MGAILTQTGKGTVDPRIRGNNDSADMTQQNIGRTDHRRADAAGDVVVAGGDVGGEWPKLNRMALRKAFRGALFLDAEEFC
jgi:hypothetical protein